MALSTQQIENDNENHQILLLGSFTIPANGKDLKCFCQNSDWYRLLFGFTALTVGIKPGRPKGQILQHLNTHKTQGSLETGGQISRNMLHQVLLPLKLLEIQDVAKHQKANIPAYNQLGSLEQIAVTKATSRNKGNRNEEIKRHYL